MRYIIVFCLVLLAACDETDSNDLQAFVAETTAKPRGRIKPLPEFKPYSAFAYSASALRSPFKSPVAFEAASGLGLDLVDAPDKSRKKFPLERFTLNELSLVGTLSQDQDELKALIKTVNGGVHIVEEGHYIGKNNGHVIGITEAKINIVEIVPNGSGGWISRPQAMALKESSKVDK